MTFAATPCTAAQDTSCQPCGTCDYFHQYRVRSPGDNSLSSVSVHRTYIPFFSVGPSYLLSLFCLWRSHTGATLHRRVRPGVSPIDRLRALAVPAGASASPVGPCLSQCFNLLGISAEYLFKLQRVHVQASCQCRQPVIRSPASSESSHYDLLGVCMISCGRHEALA